MADNGGSDAERTEEATPRRRDDARNDGRVPKSPELTIAMSLLGSAVVLSALTPYAAHGLFAIMGDALSNIGTAMLDRESAVTLLRETGYRTFISMIGFSIRTRGR